LHARKASTAAPGTYALLFEARRARRVRVGRQGTLQLRPGWYAYAGSAFGPGGVRARVGRHLAPSRRHWHVDYLRPGARLVEVWCSYDARRREHLWAETLAALSRAPAPLAGFGASDCRCDAHLSFHETRPPLRAFRARLRARDGRHAPVHLLQRNSVTGDADW